MHDKLILSEETVNQKCKIFNYYHSADDPLYVGKIPCF